MTDAELLQELARRESRWRALLRQVQQFHLKQLGRDVQPMTWIGGDTLGTHSWFGFYWKPELFWFGFGLHRAEWCPLIEADRRAPESQAWSALQQAIPSVWNVRGSTAGNLFLRLWADPGGDDESVGNWFLQRSRELHEFATA